MLCESPISKNKSRSKAFESDSFHLSLPEYCQKQNTTEAVNWSSATAYYCKSSVMICSQMYFFETYYCFKLFNWLIKVLLCNRFFSKKILNSKWSVCVWCRDLCEGKMSSVTQTKYYLPCKVVVNFLFNSCNNRNVDDCYTRLLCMHIQSMEKGFHRTLCSTLKR